MSIRHWSLVLKATFNALYIIKDLQKGVHGMRSMVPANLGSIDPRMITELPLTSLLVVLSACFISPIKR